ncbi:MAG TPA: NDP-sugar synthase [Candidatus Binataceae bacterium]|nr:NDP-sugar synthase [Candidatus Binataceae bacterium]
MRALVLAAGLGERLRPLTETTSKPLLEVGGRPLIHYVLRLLRHAGIKEIAINTHHLAEQMERTLGSGAELGISIYWSREPQLRGTGGPLNALRDFLAGDRFVIANGDSIFDLDMAAVLAFHSQHRAAATIALNRPSNLDYYSRLEIDSAARLQRMRLLKSVGRLEYNDFPARLSPAVAATLESWMYCGLIVAEPSVLDLLPARERWSLMEGLFGPMVGRGERVFGWRHLGYFRTVDDVASLDRLRAEFVREPPALDYLA